MRIIAGRLRGKALRAPAGASTRPTADRLRQTVFDMLWHAPWAGREAVEGAHVLDAFAGTGALGLEALSRGAERVVFMDNDHAALEALMANVIACRVETEARVLAANVTAPPRGAPCSLIFLDPPYGQGLLLRAVTALAAAGWIAPGALIVGELGKAEEMPPLGELVAEREQGAGKVGFWRAP